MTEPVDKPSSPGHTRFAAPLRGKRKRRVLALACAGGLLLTATAGAATGFLPVGSVVHGGSDPEAAHEHGGDQTIVARGVGSVAGPWRLAALRSAGNSHTGEPPGDCLQLQLSDPPAGAPIEATMLCESDGTVDLAAGGLPVLDRPSGRAELLLFGSAPEGTRSVDLTAEGGRALRAETADPAAGLPGRAWVMPVPRGWSAGRLRGIGPDGEAGSALDASVQLARLAEMERIARNAE